MKNLGIYSLLDFWTKIIRNNLRNFIEDPTLLSLIDEIDKIIEEIESKSKSKQKENPEGDEKNINNAILNIFQNFPIIKEIAKKTRYSANDVNIERNINLSYRRSLKNYRLNSNTHTTNKNDEEENYKTLSTTRYSFK